MLFGYFTLLVALVIETVGAYYSVTGLAAIFSGALIPILIMGASLEVGKVTAAVWLKLNWERASIAYKLYLVPAVAFLMLLTSMGIFGFLSKAHSDQNLVSGDSMAKVAIYDEKIKTEKENIEANRKALKQMDEGVDQLLGRSTDEKGADKAVAIRRSQQKERSRLQAEILQSQKSIAELNDARAPLAAEVRKVENEVGPIKYIAALLYGDNPDANILERAVRWVIILIVAVFDPLALVLILAAQQSLRWAREEQEEKRDEEQFIEAATQELLNDIELQETKPEPSLKEKYPYLFEPFVHFKNLIPMVFRTEKSDHNIIDDTKSVVVAEEVKVQDEDSSVAEAQEPIKQPEPDLSVYDDERLVTKFDKQDLAEEPKILALGVDAIERPGDYVTAPEFGIEADNVESGKQADADFGIKFPEYPKKGDLFVRVDFLPTKLFRYNGATWIELDKNATDSYAYNEQYIKHLAERVSAGTMDIEDLNDAEQDQIYEYLKNNRVQ